MDFSFEALNNLFANLMLGLKRWQFNNKLQLAFLEDLYVLINDGIPANRAIDMMAQVTTGLTREVAFSLSQKIAQGQPLAEGMQDWFNVNVIEIVRVGETGGALAQAIKSAINMLSQRGIAAGAFVSALAYPLLVIVVAGVVMVYLNKVVFSEFATIKPMVQWPASGQRMVMLADFIQYWWWITIVLVIAATLALRYVMLNYIGELRPYLDEIPPFNFYKRLAAARLLETLGLLVENGVVFKSAIRVMQYQANPYIYYHLVMMESLLGKGKTNIAEVLATGLIDEKDLTRLRVMAEVKGFEHGLVRMGLRGTDQATATLKLISRILGGFFLAVGGLLIVIIVQAVYMTGMAMGT
jgi:toxin co-regulated pilus biosynthesis protein E